MTVRGGGVPCHAMAFVPPLRMGVHHLGACRRCACMHRGSGHGDPPDTRLRRESIVPPTASSPRTRHPDHNKRVDVLGAVKARPGND